MNNEEAIKFQFVLSLDKNIICHRDFNVYGFNTKSLASMELYNYIKQISDDITYDLKNKNAECLIENENYYYNSDNNDKESGDLLLEIKMENKTINQRVFPSNYFHPKVRFTVDIRPSLNRILDDLVDILSSKDKNLNTKYLGYNLC